jgi:hypothetical protein
MGSLRPTLMRAALAAALALPASLAAVLLPSDASASVSIAIKFDELVKDADVVAIVTAGESQSIWEEGRIYTYTKVKVDQGVAGDIGAGADGWVRTMGGVVGKIGQMVDGEPVFTTGKQSLLFLHKFRGDGIFEVSARAQGQYPITVDPKTNIKKVIRSSSAGVLLPPRSANAGNASGVETQSVSPNVPGNVSGVIDPNRASLRLATDVIHDRLMEEATRDIATAWRRLHDPKAK